MQRCVKVEEEASGLATQTEETKYAQEKHTFTFCHDKNQYTVTCDVSVSVLQSLLTNKSFQILYKKKLQEGGKKELIIQRQQKPQAAVAPHFPCRLINRDECLNIRFIKSSDGTKPTEKTPDFSVHPPESLVSFYIKTRGEKNIRRPMKNNELWKTVDYVCVCAVKGEKMKEALKRDDRFNNKMLSRGALQDEETNRIMDLSNLVDSSNGKQFVIIFSPQTNSQESSQESDQTVKEEQSQVPQETSQQEQSKQGSSSAQEKTPETPQREQKKRKYPAVKKIPGTEEILALLRRQYGDLLKVLKEREKLKTDADVKRFFREEYDKTAQSFSEVKTVRTLMEFSDFVCQICINGFGRGTGFLLFDQFVLTSCHVVEDLSNLQHVEITAVFNFEDQTSEKTVKSIKSVVASKKGPDQMGNYLDFALLELECDEKSPSGSRVPKWRFNDPPVRGGVCIIGHPDGGVKQMDPCFILPKEDVAQAGVKHGLQSANPEDVFNFLTWKWNTEERELHQSQFYLNSCFFHGASGSPMFDSYCNLIGIYTGGYVYKDKGQKSSAVEYGLPINPILNYIRSQKNLNSVEAPKKRQALNRDDPREDPESMDMS